MKTFQPRQVEPGAPWRWVREAAALMARRPPAFLFSGMVMLALFLLVMQTEHTMLRLLLVLLVPPLCISGFIRLAQAADQADEFEALHILPSNAEALRTTLLAGGGYAVIFAVLMAFTAGGEPNAAMGGNLLSATDGWQQRTSALAAGTGLPLGMLMQTLLFGASISGFAALLVGLCAWFILPLMVFNRLGLVQAAMLSIEACRLNARGLGLSSFLVMLMVLVALLLSGGLLSLLMAPLAGTMLYVSYRDIFLGQPENAALPARATEPAAVAARH